MKKLVELPMEDGITIVAEVEEPEGAGGFKKATSKDGASEKVTQTFEEALQVLRPAIDRIQRTLNDLNNPDDVELQFGIKIVAGVGVVFSSASTEANFTVKLAWKNEKPKMPQNE